MTQTSSFESLSATLHMCVSLLSPTISSDQHLAPGQCSHDGCGEDVLESHRVVHELILCAYRPTPCPLGCGKNHPLATIRTHVVAECPFRMSTSLVPRLIFAGLTLAAEKIEEAHRIDLEMHPWRAFKENFYDVQVRVSVQAFD